MGWIFFFFLIWQPFESQVDPGNTGRVGPTEAALFLKRSGLPDVTLGKVSVFLSHSYPEVSWCKKENKSNDFKQRDADEGEIHFEGPDL